MKLLLGLIGQVAALNVKKTVARVKRSGIMFALAGVCFVTAYIFGLIALVLRLARHHPPEIAALFVAGGAFLLGLIALVVLAIWNRMAERRTYRRRVSKEFSLAEGLNVLQSQPLLMAALAAGLAASLVGKKETTELT